MKSATLLIALTLWLPDFANAQAPPVTTAQDWPKKVKLLQETRLDIQLGSVKANRKVPPNTEVDVLEVKLPNLVIRQNNATATIPAENTDFFERSGTPSAQEQAKNPLSSPQQTPAATPTPPQNEAESFNTRPGPETLASEEEREFFAACTSADTAKIRTMLASNPKLAKAAMVGRNRKFTERESEIGSFPFTINALQALIDKSQKNPTRIDAIKILVEGGVDPKVTTSEERTSSARGPVTFPTELTIDELEYLLAKGADPNFGWCSDALPPLLSLSLEFVQAKNPSIKSQIGEKLRLYLYYGADPEKEWIESWHHLKGPKIKSTAMVSEMAGDPELAAILAEKKKTPHTSNVEQTPGTPLADPQMILVKGGILPKESELSGQEVPSFEIGKYEVTWAEWQEVRDWALKNGYLDFSSIRQGYSPNHAVGEVSWHDALRWCNARSEQEGLQPVYFSNGSVYRIGKFDRMKPYVVEFNSSANGYRLPTEREWEWAARGGVSSKGYTYSGSNDLNAVGWYNSFAHGANPVGSKKANELGIHDMSGNLWEWCWSPVSEKFPTGSRRIRGGARHNLASYCSVANRAGYYFPEGRVQMIGFRLARNAKP